MRAILSLFKKEPVPRDTKKDINKTNEILRLLESEVALIRNHIFLREL